jgi:hypothetical protein
MHAWEKQPALRCLEITGWHAMEVRSHSDERTYLCVSQSKQNSGVIFSIQREYMDCIQHNIIDWLIIDRHPFFLRKKFSAILLLNLKIPSQSLSKSVKVCQKCHVRVSSLVRTYYVAAESRGLRGINYITYSEYVLLPLLLALMLSESWFCYVRRPQYER